MPLSRKRIQQYRNLHQSKGRRAAGQFVIEGPLLIQEALKEGWPLDEVVLTTQFAQTKEGAALRRLIKLTGMPIDLCSTTEMSRMAEAVTPQGAIALGKLPQLKAAKRSEGRAEIMLIGESISDPGNLGAILRSADWFGVESVVLGAGSADPFAPKVVRASAGAIFRVDIAVRNDVAAEIRRETRADRKLYAATIEGELKPDELPREGRRGLVLGHEKRGLSEEIASLCTSTVRIPARGRGESLNLAVAAGILLYALSSRS